MAPVYETVNVTSVNFENFRGKVFYNASLNIGAVRASGYFQSLNESVPGTSPGQMIGQAFDGTYDSNSNGLHLNTSEEFGYVVLMFSEPVFLLSVSFDINSTQVVSGTIEHQELMRSYGLQTPFSQDVYTNDTVVFDFMKNGGLGFYSSGVVFATRNVSHIGEINIAIKRAADFIPSDLLSVLRNIEEPRFASPYFYEEWEKNNTSWKSAKYYPEKYHSLIQFEITPVPSSVVVPNLFRDMMDYNQDPAAERECVPSNVTQLEIVPSYALQMTTVDMVWDQHLSEDIAKRPDVIFEGWDGSTWSPLIRTTLQFAKTHEIHQYVPVISKKLKISINYRDTSASLCLLNWDAALVANEQHLIQTSSTTSVAQATSTTTSAAQATSTTSKAAQATSTAQATLVKSAATPTTTPKKSAGIKTAQSVLLFAGVIVLSLMV